MYLHTHFYVCFTRLILFHLVCVRRMPSFCIFLQLFQIQVCENDVNTALNAIDVILTIYVVALQECPTLYQTRLKQFPNTSRVIFQVLHKIRKQPPTFQILYAFLPSVFRHIEFYQLRRIANQYGTVRTRTLYPHSG